MNENNQSRYKIPSGEHSPEVLSEQEIIRESIAAVYETENIIISETVEQASYRNVIDIYTSQEISAKNIEVYGYADDILAARKEYLSTPRDKNGKIFKNFN